MKKTIPLLIFLLSAKAFSSETKSSYTQELWFDVVNSGSVAVKGPLLNHEFRKDKKSKSPQSLQFNGFEFTDTTLSVTLSSRQKLEADVSRMSYWNQDDMILFFDWPRDLVPGGKIEVSNQNGELLWSKAVGEAELAGWKQKITQVQEQLKTQGKTPEEIAANPLLKTTYAFFKSKEDPGPSLREKEKYKFCLRNQQSESSAALCTPFHEVTLKGIQFEMAIVRSTKNPSSLTINDTDKGPQGSELLRAGDSVKVVARLESGASLEFKSQVPAFQIDDMIESSTAGKADLVSHGPRPVFLASESFSRYGKNYWKSQVPATSSGLLIPGDAGGFFLFDLEIKKLPAPQDRALIKDYIRPGIYSSADPISVYESRLDQVKPWILQNKVPGQEEKSYLDIESGSDKFKAYFETYRGHPGEVSLRLTGLVTSDGSKSVMPEIHAGYWFNSLFGWENNALSRQRWGVSAKHFSLLSPIGVKTGIGDETLDTSISSTIVDLKYRFKPGLWERDETWGALISYEDLHFGSFQVPKLGAGIFWARSMPSFFDDLLNHVPWFRYPKWVDLDLTKYSAADSRYVLGDDYSVNFHGKILWTPTLYGEAGFGIKNYYFIRQEDQRGASLNTFYGTLGLGLNF